MSFTVGKLEEILRNFSKGTEIYNRCGNCHHSSNVDLRIEDRTDSTYGYIELVVNDRKDPKVQCAADEKEFYIREIERLNQHIKGLENTIENYKYFTDRAINNLESLDKFNWSK